MNNALKIMSVGLALGVASSALAAGDIPGHPREIQFDELLFEPPVASDYRHELSNGTPVFMAISNEFPLVTIRFSFTGGEYLEPAGKAGLASLTGQLIRTGGNSAFGPSEMDEEFDFLAANASASIGGTTSGASINYLTSTFDDSFAMFMDMVKTPRFDADRLEVLRSQMLEGIKTRNDDGLQIAIREMGFLMWGQDHFEGRVATKGSIESITVDDISAFHARIFNPSNLMISVTGDFDRAEMLTVLNDAMESWKMGEVSGDVPAPTQTFTPGVYYYEKDQPQVQVLIGHRGIQRDNPDAVDVSIMNDILGGSGFTSRITNTVRTREGLAYTAGSVMSNRVEYPGMFMSYFFTKTPTAAFATKLVFDEFDLIQKEAASTDEIEIMQNSAIETFPRTFESKRAMMGLFMSDERTGRASDHWQTYRDRVRSVDPAGVQRAANEYLHPEDMVILIVGPWDEIKAGNAASEPDPERMVTMDAFFDGKATEIPQRDAETMESGETTSND
ncbi:MAG: insulinase family protein [Phycisphaerales bacterium]|nr:insulinase family protein [Phycisphaerales bacterium]